MYGLIGKSLNHSFSSNYFKNKFEKLGLKEIYRNFPLESITFFPKCLAGFPEIKGLNVTIPYKEEIIPYLQELSPIAEKIQAVNCIEFYKDKLIGHNTDVIGFQQSIKPLLKNNHREALVLGSGGASKAVRYALEQLGIYVNVVSRNNNADLSYKDLHKNVIQEHLIIINTTPLGTFPNIKEAPDFPYEYISQKHLLYDLVYNPEETLFLKKGRQKNCTIKNGYEMLVLQAEESWRIWNKG